MYIHFNKIFYGSKARKLDEDIYSNRGPSNTTFIKQKNGVGLKFINCLNCSGISMNLTVSERNDFLENVVLKL